MTRQVEQDGQLDMRTLSSISATEWPPTMTPATTGLPIET
jgi:hypothetical protein